MCKYPPSGGPDLSEHLPDDEPLDVEPTEPPAPDHWGGLPPVGKRPIEDRWRYAGEVVGVFFVWLAIWAVYRYWRTVSGVDDTVLGPILSIVAPVFLTLSLPIIWWRYRRRERGLPFLLTRRNMFSSILVACLAVVAFFIFYFISYPIMIGLMGAEVPGDLTFWADWRAYGLGWLIATTLFYMVIIGPVEELFHRGFVQDQINRAFSAWFGILVASVVFVLGHVPIDFMVYQLDLAGWGLRWLSSFPFAIGAGVFYHWSRNIWGVAVYHGLYDLFLSLSRIEFGATGPELPYSAWYAIFAVWFIAELVILVAFSYAAYRLLWKGDRPGGSLGFYVRGISDAAPGRGLIQSAHRFLASRRIVGLARRVDRSGGHTREVLSLALIGIVIFGNLFISGAFGQVPDFTTGGGNGPGSGVSGQLETLPMEREHRYVYDGTTEDFAYLMGEERYYAHINLTLTWVDESPPLRFTNEPDTLRVELFLDDGDEYVMLASDSGSGNDVSGGAL
ncbi:MAG: CPBP family intramembrane metalloprotease [Thermoplasmata archaeon]|nr:MAG: CPBP family intramembrane metalloprotease [Thermoplasmata archaeon]